MVMLYLNLDTPTFTQETPKKSEAYLSPEFKRKLELWNDKMKETKGNTFYQK